MGTGTGSELGSTRGNRRGLGECAGGRNEDHGRDGRDHKQAPTSYEDVTHTLLLH